MLVTRRAQRVKFKGTWEMFRKDNLKIDLIILDQLVESILLIVKQYSNNLGKSQQQSQLLTSSCLYPD